ncbi:hypothetical protein CY35_13G043500 [Sphagnum magellanicum]|nr:hypothetical protein CY35_13G043500 [Sphagnum magellanicum]
MATMAVPMHTCSAAASTVLGSLCNTPPVVCSISACSSTSSSSLGYKKSVSGFSFSLGFVSQPLGISKVSSSRIRDSFPRVLARAPGAKERDKSSSQQREAAAAAKEEAAAAVQGDVYDDEEEEEVEISWIQEKVEDVVLVTSQAMERVPGPRVGDGQLPWLVAVPLGYLGITFVIAVVRSWRKFNSSKERRKRQIGNNAYFCEALGEYLPEKREQLDHKKLQALANKCNFSLNDALRKYIRYALNERAFNPVLVADLIHLRKVSNLTDAEVAEVLNDVSRRIVKAKGPVVMNLQGFTEKGIKRKAAVQALFTKLLYLSE